MSINTAMKLVYFLFFAFTCCHLGASGPAIVLKHTKSTAIFSRIALEPETIIMMEFWGNNLQGRLLYAENATTGTFISLKLVRPGTLSLEIKLSSLSQSLSASHQLIHLSVALNIKMTRWNSIELRIQLHENHAVLFVNGKNAFPIQITGKAPLVHEKYAFGSVTYLGRVTSYMNGNNNQLVHYTASMEPSFMGIIRNFVVNGVKMKPKDLLNGAEIAFGLSFCDRKNVYNQQEHNCPAASLCRDQNDDWSCGCTSFSTAGGMCQFR